MHGFKQIYACVRECTSSMPNSHIDFDDLSRISSRHGYRPQQPIGPLFLSILVRFRSSCMRDTRDNISERNLKT